MIKINWKEVLNKDTDVLYELKELLEDKNYGVVEEVVSVLWKIQVNKEKGFNYFSLNRFPEQVQKFLKEQNHAETE